MRISKSCGVKVGITIGDPSGIGPYITTKALAELRDLADFTIIGDAYVLGFPCGGALRNLKRYGVRIVDLDNVKHRGFRFGKISAEYGRASIEYLDTALSLVKDGLIDCLVTCPISKESISKAGFHFSGHTEYLSLRAHAKDTVMMLLNKDLKVSLVTRHIPLAEVPLKLNKDIVFETILLTFQALKEMFSLRKPKVAVCGLNPHASDHGVIGGEEGRIIKPALRALRKKGICADGPFSADVAIAKTNQGQYDAVIAMYHDQALIPLKLSGDYSGVNITLGLPFVRTSPLHGTAFDIAGTNRANPASLKEAIELAVKCTLNLKRG